MSQATASEARTQRSVFSSDIPFARRHNGPTAEDVGAMLEALGLASIGELLERAVPHAIRRQEPLSLAHGVGSGLSEHQALQRLRSMAAENRIARSYIGMGYSDCITPPVIQRNILENPGWYTAYTPYQAEIAQGRLEALLNFQTLIIDLTGLPVANASLLDEATAAAEAMSLAWSVDRQRRRKFFVSAGCHPQTVEVVRTRAWPLEIEVLLGEQSELIEAASSGELFGALFQYPRSEGAVEDPSAAIAVAHDAGALAIVAADPLALVLLRCPAELGADVAVGSTQRFGMPMGYGGPHAAYLATRDEYRRSLPGRVVGVSKDAAGRPALRLALQTREQHIRREKATSNICTAQVLPAVIASTYAVYHGPEGLRTIAERVHALACGLATGLEGLGATVRTERFFDTLQVEVGDARARVLTHAEERSLNLRGFADGSLGIALDETTSGEDVGVLLEVFARALGKASPSEEQRVELLSSAASPLAPEHRRQDAILEHQVFHAYRSETEMLRYLHRLETRDLSLTTSMIPLGSCTMKLNAAAEMLPITWPGFAAIHPFAPEVQTRGYQRLCRELGDWLTEITGFDAVSLQPNAGSQGELAGLLTIRRYQHQRGETQRNVCLIPTSAHGTNPASAVMAGLEVVAVRCDSEGNIDLADLEAKAHQHTDRLAAIMVTYPSTHGVFEETIREICDVVHRHGGQVYLDGANLNAQVGVCRPGDYGADVCHLNLHKTFCIPHGGGGPGMGPIAVREHLAPFLPGHGVVGLGDERSIGAIAAAPFGSGAILPISWAYIAMMGAHGLAQATALAILNANYMARRLEGTFDVLYKGRNGLVAHECILDLRPLRAGKIEVEDVAKRLMDYGFHAPTVSWPVAGTVMVEPTESESKAELDRYCDALIQIRAEAEEVLSGMVALEESALHNAPHTALDLLSETWDRPYSRTTAAFPVPWLREHKYWPPVSRIDNVWGDRHLVCSCAGMEAYDGEGA